MESFYISCQLGFEESLQGEIREVWPWLIGLNGQPHQEALPEMVQEKGGVLIKTSFELGLQLNFFLKTAHRVLWRVAEFKVRDFPKLFEKIQKIPWGNYLQSREVEWVVAAAKSRLNHEKRIEETCKEAFQKISGKITEPKEASESFKQSVYVRLYDDLCTVSLDTSGENLHKRGWGSMKGEAPLRETLASYLVRQLMEEVSPAHLKEVTMVDPLCGSGTILLEAASLWQPVFKRAFSFLKWKNTPKILKSALLSKNYQFLSDPTPFKKYLGFDLNEKVLVAARENLRVMKEHTAVGDFDIRFEKEDLFSGAVRTEGEVWCLANPPYGERLHVQGQDVFSYQDLLQRLGDKFHAEKIGVLLPNKSLVRSLTAPSGYHKTKEVPFSNGGLDVLFLVFSKGLS